MLCKRMLTNRFMQPQVLGNKMSHASLPGTHDMFMNWLNSFESQLVYSCFTALQMHAVPILNAS